MIIHPIKPVFDKDSRILILGSFPSVKSREKGFFYGHPQNRFWRVTAQVFGEETPLSIDEKRSFLLRNHIALWDVIGSCEIDGSSDSSIRNVTVNDLSAILKTAEQLYKKYLLPTVKRDAVCLPSTSPANAAWSIEKLVEAWKIIAE